MALLTSTPTQPASKCKCAHCTHLKEQEDCEGQAGDYKDYEDDTEQDEEEDDEEHGDYEDYEGEDEDGCDQEDPDPPQSKYTDADFAQGLQEEAGMQPKTREKLLALAATEGDVDDKTLHPMLQRITIDIEAHIQHPEWIEAVCTTPVAAIFDVDTMAQLGRIVPELPCKKMVVISVRFLRPMELPVVPGSNHYSFDVSAAVHVDKEHWVSWSSQNSVPRETETETWSLQRDPTNALVLRLKRFNQYNDSPVMYAAFSASSPRQWTGLRIIMESTRLALMIQQKDEHGMKRATGCCGAVQMVPIPSTIFMPPAPVEPVAPAPVVDLGVEADPAPVAVVEPAPAAEPVVLGDAPSTTPGPCLASVNPAPVPPPATISDIGSLLSVAVSSAVTAAVNAALSHCCQCHGRT